MSNDVRLSARLAKDEELNGLDHLAAELMADDDQTLCAIVWLKVVKITEDVPEGHRYPTVAIARIEPIGTPEEVPGQIVELALERFEARLGKLALPFDSLEVVEGAYSTSTGDE